MADRYRNWVVIAYPESMPDDVIPEEYLDNFLNSLHIPCARSPFHHGYTQDQIVEERKDHYHVLLTFAGVKSQDQIIDLLNTLKAKPSFLDQENNKYFKYDVFCRPQPCQSIRGSIRYFAHLDNPEKEQLLFSDIKEFGGFDKTEVGSLTSSEESKIMCDMDDFIEKGDVTEYSTLVDYARSHHPDTWYWVLLHTAYRSHINQYLSSKRNKLGMAKIVLNNIYLSGYKIIDKNGAVVLDPNGLEQILKQ